MKFPWLPQAELIKFSTIIEEFVLPDSLNTILPTPSERDMVWKTVNTAGLRLLSLEDLVCKAGPRLESGNLDLGRVPTTPSQIRVVHCG